MKRTHMWQKCIVKCTCDYGFTHHLSSTSITHTTNTITTIEVLHNMQQQLALKIYLLNSYVYLW